MSHLDDFREFDPTKLEKTPWGTYVAGRNPKWRLHANRAAALNAFSQHTNLASLWYFGHTYDGNDSRWMCIAIKDKEAVGENCQMCSRSVMEPYRFATSGFRNAGRFEWMRERGKLVEPLRMLLMCDACYKLNRS